MRIVNIILTSVNGGAEQVFVDYCCVLKERLGHDVLAIIKQDAPYAYELEKSNIPLKKITNNFGFYDIFAINEIKNILQEFDADVVVAHVGRSMILTRKAIKKIKNKKILQVAVNHSMNIKRSIGADIIISVNREMFFSTINHGQNLEKSFVINNAIDLSDLHIFEPKIDWLKKDVTTLGCIGRFDKAKGFCFAIKALKLLKNHDKKFRLKIAGSGKEEKFLRNLAKELLIEDLVEFTGWVKDKKSFFDNIDIFLLTSQKETFGLVILEAMKFGKPVIACDVDGPREIIIDGDNGLLIAHEPLNNIEERFANAIKKLVKDCDLTNNLVKNAFTALQKKFSFDILTEKLEDIFGRKK